MSNLKYFEVNQNITIKCESKSTSRGFKHIATLQNRLSEDLDSESVNYINRTWERFTFESVLNQLVEKTHKLSNYQKRVVRKFIKNGARVDDELKPLKTVALVAGLGEVFGETQEQKNDWKKRMLKAGLEGQGLDIPEDWDELSEDEKETRLNGAIEQLAK